jgi:hypothetical protein
MGFSIRDEKSRLPNLRSQSGQGIIEYILVLIVVVAIILGGLYQLNSAFRDWALNYFGQYLACLLETGELPTIGGSPGDSGICNELFKPFNLADGRRLAAAGPTQLSPGDKDRGTGNRERGGLGQSPRGFSRVGGSGGGGFRGGGRGGSSSQAKNRKAVKGKSSASYTGSTESGNYGGNYGKTNRKLNTGVKYRLDNKFAFDDTAEKQNKARTAVAGKKNDDGRNPASKKYKVQIRKEMAKDDVPDADTGMDFPNFMRYLIIAAIVIALILFIGGQMLQIGKSME